MKPEWRRFAPLGLVISSIAVLVSIGLYVVFRRFDLAMQISLGLIVIGLALFALLDPARDCRKPLSGPDGIPARPERSLKGTVGGKP